MLRNVFAQYGSTDKCGFEWDLDVKLTDSHDPSIFLIEVTVVKLPFLPEP